MLVAGTPWFKDLGEYLHEKYGKEYNVVHKLVPKFIMRIVSIWDSEAAAIMPLWGLEKTFDNKETKDILGIEFIDPKQSTLDMAETLIDTGYIPDKRKKN